jgi:hypothetical protein
MINPNRVKPLIPNIKSEFKYNRLIIVGNGFDLGLGLETSYNDFILFHIKEVFKNTIQLRQFDSGLIEASTNLNYGVKSINDLNKRIDTCKNVTELISLFQNDIKIKFKTIFIKDIFENKQINKWVDIESLYFKNLIKLFKLVIDKPFDKKDYSKIAELNQSMDMIEQGLKDYIQNEQNRHGFTYVNSHFKPLIDSFFEPIRKKENSLIPEQVSKDSPQTVFFVNFNYTNSLTKLLKNSSLKDNREIQIHGSVNDLSNPIIFGYGNDIGSIYSELEEEDNVELLRKIKSFAYPSTNNYHNLLNILDSLPYEVFIVGHSCGVSDKTMLNTIFQHPKCLAIKNYHYAGEKEDFYKRISISRHFSDKPLMRKRVLPFDEWAKIPQKK